MEGKLLFVGGDLYGIQKFIYNITSKKAMVSLKGRSAYLKQFTDEICNSILEIPQAKEIENSGLSKGDMKIYCSGGKFYLQVPNAPYIKEGINGLVLKTERELWEKHKGQLSINIAYFPFEYVDQEVKIGDTVGNIGILWQQITKMFNTKNNQRFKSILLDQTNYFFDVQKVGGHNVNVCQVTGIEGAVIKKIKFGENVEELCILKSVYEQIVKGQHLRSGFKMLEEYAGSTYLGVLRMDVDNLGGRFVKGFDSMESYRKFSNALDRFFDVDEGNLHKVYDQYDYKDFVNIVYAGGDDLFAVGRWDKVIDFAHALAKDFQDFCKETLKEKLTISGGIAIVDPRFPISKAAEMAGEAEDAAKQYNSSVKNAFNMFGESVSWENEFDYVMEKSRKFVELISDKGLSHSILHRIKRYAEMVKENKVIEEENKNGNHKRKPDMSYLWNTTYFLTRFMGKEDVNKEVYDFCKELRDNELHTPEQFRLMSLAARWAELELRIDSETNSDTITNNTD